MKECYATKKNIEDFSFKNDFSFNEILTGSEDEYINLYREDQEDVFEKQYMLEEYFEYVVLEEVMKILTPTEKQIILKRFFYQDEPEDKPLENISNTEMVKIEHTALRKMYRFFSQNIDLLRRLESDY